MKVNCCHVALPSLVVETLLPFHNLRPGDKVAQTDGDDCVFPKKVVNPDRFLFSKDLQSSPSS
jgi:hypothetical protein